MGLFGPKLTTEQKDAVGRTAEEIGLVRNEALESFRQLVSPAGMASIYQAGYQAQSQGRDRLLASENDLARARQVMEAHRTATKQQEDTIERIVFDDWFPKKLKKAHEETLSSLRATMKMNDTVLEALSEPGPLCNQPGLAKLNMLVSGLNVLAMMARGMERPVRV